MNKKAYLVLSVREIRRMLKVASRQARRANLRGRSAGNHCIVFEKLEVINRDEKDGQLQICSADLSMEVNRLSKHEDEMDAAGV